MIEKRITEAMLDSGELRLSQREANDVELPEHSTQVVLELEGETFVAQWSAGGRSLHGELLLERLQDYAQINGLLRLRRVGDQLRLHLLPAGTAQLAPSSGRLFDLRTDPPRREPQRPAPPMRAKRRSSAGRAFHADTAYDWGRSATPTVGFLKPAREATVEQLTRGGFDPRALVRLRVRGEELATMDDFEELLAVDVSNVDRMPHQEAVARQVLSKMRGRAVLADEVGLGKTIEAGLIAKELSLRGLAKRMLVICPAPLREQWRDEMAHKFDLSFDIAQSGWEVGEGDRQIMSLQLAIRNRERLTKPYDLVVLDEAHRLAGANANKTRDMVTDLTTAARYVLFLTATPIQNDLMELYRLVQLLRPGTLTSPSEFRRTYMRVDNPREPSNPADLRRLVSSAMVRTTRAQAGVDRVTRHATDVAVRLGAREQELYVLCTQLLRKVMTEPADAMRRRSLALRLSANPFSMGTTALRMAERHPNPRVSATLRELGHMAMDIRESARETQALKMSERWLSEHGRVLVFTQHTDTVTALLRRYEREGITAVPFHGGMAPKQRASSISQFKSGRAPVMISTDAGAEGQNLQFCNCVINYDLPWNPMRIEQRIGRVDRLTQPKDDVFIANLFARGTIDESVYRLLAEKLRMFELLFGQVTTILGELDEGKSTTTFEGRVLEALFAPTDDRMHRLLGSLGTELSEARERAADLIAADTGLSSWLKTAPDHRKGLTKRGATELAPTVEARSRQRQAAVQEWAREVVLALGGTIRHDTGRERGAFLTVEVPDLIAGELGGRENLHLAFDRHGLEHHPDAELCAVGSPVFEELLALLRQRGDINLVVPAPPEPGPSPSPASDAIELVSRRFVETYQWRGRATFRAAIGEGEPQEHLITVEVGEAPDDETLPRRELGEGETFPETFGAPKALVSQLEGAARDELETRRRALSDDLRQRRQEELARVEAGYLAQLDEARGEDRDRLRRALTAEQRRLGRDVDVRARAELLAIELDEADWVVAEQWQHRKGAEAWLTYRWNAGAAPLVESDVSGAPIEVLSLCSDGHWVDVREVATCSSCDEDRCDSCGTSGSFAECHLCGVDACGACRRDTGGLCRFCFEPTRVPDRDIDSSVAWLLPDGRLMHVSERACTIEGGGAPIVPDDDVDDPARVRTRAAAAALGLPIDVGLLVRHVPPPTHDDPSELLVSTSSRVHTTVEISIGSGSTVDSSGVDHLAEYVEVATRSERGAGLTKLLASLRSLAPAPPVPSLVVKHQTISDEVVLTADALIERARAVDDVGAAVTLSSVEQPIEWTANDVAWGAIGAATLGSTTVQLERLNRALLVETTQAGTTARWAACPGDTTVDVEFTCAQLLAYEGAPGGVLHSPVVPRPTRIVGVDVDPSECRLEQRDVESIFDLLPVSDSDATRVLTAADLADVVLDDASAYPLTTPLPTLLADRLLQRAAHPPTHALRHGLRVRETWTGNGTASRSVTTYDGYVPPVEDSLDQRPLRDFGVCRSSHFHPAWEARECPSCRTFACSACSAGGPPLAPCTTCQTPTCLRCRDADHTVSAAVCAMCGNHACANCGTDPHVAACSLCSRLACVSHRVDGVCSDCATLHPASPTFVTQLPLALAAAGATVWCSDETRQPTVVVLMTATRRELAVIDGESILDWVSFLQDPWSDTYQLSLAASRSLGAQVEVERTPTVEPEPDERHHLVLHRSQGLRATLDVPELGRRWVSNRTHDRVNADLLIDALDAVGAAGSQPGRWLDTPDALHRLSVATPPVPARAAWGWQVAGSETILTVDGLVVRQFLGIEVDTHEEPWHDVGDEPPWWRAGWYPHPTMRWISITEHATVALGSFGRALVAGLTTTQGTSWAWVRVAPGSQAATAVARLGALAEADFVGPSTTPAAIVRSTVVNASEHSVTVLPVVEVDVSGAQPVDAIAVLHAWNPTATIASPTTVDLPAELVEQLAARFSAPPALCATVGAHVTEQFRLTSGGEFRHEARLRPGDHVATQVDRTTAAPTDQGWVDREGHFSGSALSCVYCHELACAVCMTPPTSCGWCGIQLCSQCVAQQPDGRPQCPACASVHRPSRSEARQHGRILSTRGLLIGSDDVHSVTFERDKSSWRVVADDGTMALQPAAATHLDQRYAALESQ